MGRRDSLPIDPLLAEIVASLARTPSLVVEAPPGAGKTTRVPAALLEPAASVDGAIWVLEPRRLAARMAARRVADELGASLGGAVGYQVRFDEAAGPHTRLRFVTEGVLTRRLLADPELAGIGAVVLDEFHERHLQADLALALLARLQRTSRPDLRLVAMSATLDAAPVARFLGDCPRLRSEGRLHSVEVEHLARPDERPLALQVASALGRLIERGLDGDVLVFLPGAAEIRRAAEACAILATRADLLVVPLHGDLAAEEQDRAVRRADRRKVVLSTNVAETSVTIDGVVAVVDSGLARVAGHASWSGLPTLTVSRISRASATQRAGRAGRTRPGLAVRLYTATDFAARPEFDAPEVARLDLAETALELHAAGVRDLASFDWFEPPPAEALDAAERLLARLGAVDARGAVTDTGRRMLTLPLHPRLARLVVEGASRGVADEASLVAALAGERDIRARGTFDDRRPAAPMGSGPSDLLELADRFTDATSRRGGGAAARAFSLDAGAVRAVERVRGQLVRVARRLPTAPRPADTDDALLVSILTAFPDRVARRRGVRDGRVELTLATGGGAELAPESVVGDADLVVAVDAELTRSSTGGRATRRGQILVRSASAIEPEWLLELYPEAIRESDEVLWNTADERVEVVGRLLYDGLVLDETRRRASASDEASHVLAAAAEAAGLDAFFDRTALDRYLARVAFAAAHAPSIPVLDDADAAAALAGLCYGLSSFAELRDTARHRGVAGLFSGILAPEQARLVAAYTPETVSIAGRRGVRVEYERDRPPWIASRLQDFFGMREGPRVAGGRVAVVLHLLAPNRRPVQVTADLAGFWERHYPQVRRELSRRYPRHKWPENPLAP